MCLNSPVLWNLQQTTGGNKKWQDQSAVGWRDKECLMGMWTEWQSSDTLLVFPGTFSTQWRAAVCLYRVHQSFPHTCNQWLELSQSRFRATSCFRDGESHWQNTSVPWLKHGSSENESILYPPVSSGMRNERILTRLNEQGTKRKSKPWFLTTQ